MRPAANANANASADTDQTKYRFTFGPWNISTGADPFGPPVRKEVAFAARSRRTRSSASTACSSTTTTSSPPTSTGRATQKGVAEVKKMLDGEGLFGEFVAPRLWEDPRTIDGGFTSNSAADRKYALDRAKRRRRHRPRARLQELRPLAGPRGHLHPRGQGRR